MRKFVGIALGALILLGATGAGIEFLRESLAQGDSIIPALLILAIPVLVAGIVVAWVLRRLVRPLQRHPGITGLIALAVSAAVGGGVYAVNTDVPVQRPDAAVTAAVAPACAGQAVAAAGGIVTDRSRLNHVVVLDTNGVEFAWTGKPSVEWRPPTVDDVELVACVQAEETLSQIEVCAYKGGPSTTRYSATREIRVMAARSGAQVARFSITDEPGNCPFVKSSDEPEMKGSVDWPVVRDHLDSIVTQGAFIDADAVQTPGPEDSLEPWQSDEPITTPEPTAEIRELSLAAALDDGLVTARATGDSLQSLDMTITSKAHELLDIMVPAGTYFVPKRSATQTMVVIYATWIEVPAGETVKAKLNVACAQMHDDQPGEAGKADTFTVKETLAGGDLATLLKSDAFHAADFRLQQFAVWTITSNPTKSGYVHLGTFGVGSGPSAAELGEIKAMFKEAGISTGRYRALP